MTRRVTRLLYLTLATVAIALPFQVTSAQFVERAPVPKARPAGAPAGNEEPSPTDELIQSFNFEYSDEAPVARMKLAKYWARVQGHYIPFYMFSNFATLIPSGKNAITLSSKELISQFGGLANLAFAPSFTAFGAVEGKEGLQGDIRIGAKAVNYQSLSGANSYAGVGQLGATVSYYIPFGDKTNQFVQKGLLTVNLRPTLNYLGSTSFRGSFDPTGAAIPSFVGGFVADASFNLFEQFILSAGYSASSSQQVKSRGFAGVTISRSPTQR